MKKIVVQDKFIIFIFIIIFILLFSITMIVYPDNNNIAEKNWYIRAIIFGIYGIFLFFYSLREQIKYIMLLNNKIIIKHRKLLKSQIYEINKSDILDCRMYVYRGNIYLNFNLNNGMNLKINHTIVTAKLIEQISQISNFTDKFDYVICKSDFPNNADIFEKIINKDKKIIKQQNIISLILAIAFSFLAILILICSILD